MRGEERRFRGVEMVKKRRGSGEEKRGEERIESSSQTQKHISIENTQRESCFT
jgi:hypothetical protein